MSERVSIGSLYPGSFTPANRTLGKAGAAAGTAKQSFEQLLQTKLLTFSHHAESRLSQRGIRLQPEQLAKLEEAVDKAAAKGSKDSLILLNDLAFIVNVKSKTVITAMDGASLANNVFTQIDSAVIVP